MVSTRINEEFDLRPDPRVLPMLGEINIDQWRCVAELVDNAIDGFLNAARGSEPVDNPRVDVILPSADKEGAHVRIIDNGHGMTPEVLQRAVSAGWSGNNPIDNLGLFGMGFNIATARLGSTTEVWTTRQGDAEWHGLEIDFDKLRRQRHFRTAHLRRPKADPDQHGTEVTIKRLKPEQRKWLSRTSNRSIIRNRLSQTYSSMLRRNGAPISFTLLLNNNRVEARRHCLWNEERSVQVPDFGQISVSIPIDHAMAARPYCTHCMNWLSPESEKDEPCPVCSTEGTVAKRTRRVTGWIGIQRFLDQTEFGFDFIRNGRKIEIGNKDLFTWRDSDSEEREYPIDDQRGRGRIVGEIHIDHCRVSYAKDRFDRTDPSWDDMVHLIRGEGPLRPEKARSLGYSGNDSPLFQLFKAFRRSSPHNKTAGAWKRIMVVKDNDRATEMATYFQEGRPEYQDDTKWWELIEEEDLQLLYGGKKSDKDKNGEDDEDAGGLPKGLVDDEDDQDEKGSEQGEDYTGDPEPAEPVRRREVPSLSRKFTHHESGVSWNVTAFEVNSHDPDLPEGAPWAMPLADVATRNYHFLVRPTHPAFRSMTMTPLDALLTQLAWMTSEALRTTREAPQLATILAELREQYGGDNKLDPRAMIADAAQILTDIAKNLVASCPEEDRPALFNDLPVAEQQSIMRILASKKIKPTQVTSDGSFLQYAPYDVLRLIMESHPEYCFDGNIWDEPYESLDYQNQEITDNARETTMVRYLSLLGDTIWLARQDVGDIESAPRDELIRALMSMQIVRPDVEST